MTPMPLHPELPVNKSKAPSKKKALLKKTISLFLLFALVLSTSGCWNRREVQELSINTALGIDRIVVEGKPRFRISVLTIRPAELQAGGGGGKSGGGTPGRSQSPLPSLVLAADGETIYDAMRNYSVRFPRQLFLAHTMVIVIGEEMAKEGIGQIIDILLRHPDMRPRTWVVVTEGSALDALQLQPEVEPSLAQEINNLLLRSRPRGSKTQATNLFQLADVLLTPGKEAVVSRLQVITPPEASSPIRQGTSAAKNGGGSGSKQAAGTTPSRAASSSPEAESKTPAEPYISPQDQPQKHTFILAGAAAFRGDRLAGWLNEEETQGLQFITNRASQGVIPVAFDAEEKNASLVFRHAKAKVTPVVENGQIRIEVKIKGQADFLEEKNAVINLGEEDLKKLEQLGNQEVERRCQMAVVRAQELKTDILGFGDLIHRRKPRVWKEIKEQWENIFPTLPVEISADIKVEHSGLLGEPILVE